MAAQRVRVRQAIAPDLAFDLRRVTTRGDSRIRMVSRRRPIGDSCSSVPARVARMLTGSSTRSATFSTSEPTATFAADQRAQAGFQLWIANGLVR